MNFLYWAKKEKVIKYIFWEEQITRKTTMLRIILAGGFESNSQSASKRKESLELLESVRLKSCGQRKSSNSLSDLGIHHASEPVHAYKLTMAAALRKKFLINSVTKTTHSRSVFKALDMIYIKKVDKLELTKFENTSWRGQIYKMSVVFTL